MRGVTGVTLLKLLDFMYNGEVNIAQAELSSFLAVAEDLQVAQNFYPPPYGTLLTPSQQCNQLLTFKYINCSAPGKRLDQGNVFNLLPAAKASPNT